VNEAALEPKGNQAGASPLSDFCEEARIEVS